MAVRTIRVKVNGRKILGDALDTAVQCGMNKTDKWCSPALTDSQRKVLAEQIASYFWVELDEAGVSVE